MSEDMRLLAAFRSSPGAIGISDISQGGRLLDVNESWEKLTGYSRVEALGHSTVELEIVSPETFALFRQRLQTDGRIRGFELQFRRKEGSTGTGLLSSELLTLDGKPCAVTTTIDISKRKRAEEALRASELRFRGIFDSTYAFIGLLSPDGILLEANQTALNIIAMRSEEVIGKPFWETPWWNHSPALQQRLRQLIMLAAQGEIQHGEAEHVAHDGRVLKVEYTLKPVFDEHGMVSMIIPEGRDITALAVSETRFRTAFDLVPHTMAIHDGEGRILDANAVLCKCYGVNRQEIFGHFITEFLEVSRDSAFFSDIDILVSALHGPVEIITRQRAGGQPRNVLLSAVEATLDGKPCFVTCWVDITALRKVEHEFRHAQKMEAVGRLAGGIAHDFNNLLTVINGYSDLALKRLLEQDPLRPAIGEIRKAGERAAGLSRQLLTLSRKQVVEARPIDLSTMIRESCGMLERLVGEDVKITEELAAAGMVKADPGQMNQILMNLVVNARDAMPEGGRITLRVLRLELEQAPLASFPSAKAGPHVVLEVSDTGVGMSQEIQAKIFEPFFTTKNERGTGLGLATVYGIVQQAGGWIGVESQPGRGTTFRIGFPVVTESLAEERTPETPAVQPQGIETVLVVEDRAEVRKLAIASLRSFGYQTLEASSGEEALHLAQGYSGPIHLLLADVVMPEMNGRQLANRLRAILPDTKVLFMTGHAEELVSRQGLLEPGMEYLRKPFTPEMLAQKVRKLLGEPRAGGKILVVDSDEEIRIFLAAVLQERGYEVVMARNLQEAQEVGVEDRFDIMIAEVDVSRLGDADLIRAVHSRCSGLKVIAIAGMLGSLDRHLWQGLGVDLALQKPISPDLLQSAVRDLLAREEEEKAG